MQKDAPGSRFDFPITLAPIAGKITGQKGVYGDHILKLKQT